MTKTATLNVRVDPKTKEKAEEVLEVLGISMSTAINMYLNQIVLTKSIPFQLVSGPYESPKEIIAGIERGIADAEAGRGMSLDDFVKEFKKEHNIVD